MDRNKSFLFIYHKISYPGLSGLSFLNGDGVSTSGSRNCGERGSDESEISERGFRAKLTISPNSKILLLPGIAFRFLVGLSQFEPGEFSIVGETLDGVSSF